MEYLKNLFRNNKTAVYIAAACVLSIALYFFQNYTQLSFEASILSELEQSIHFDGTVYPIQKIPNWVVWKGDVKTTPYSSIPGSQLLPIPAYDANQLKTPADQLKWGDAGDNRIRNAKLTYSVVYLGNYELDGVENSGNHPGVDIRVPIGTPVYAIANGVVTKVQSQNSGFGRHVVVKHPRAANYPESNRTTDLFSSYSHLSKTNVQVGTIVLKGQKIGEVGTSGTVTTPHLHFQIDRDSAPWHPFWPFTSADARTAGLTFIGAVNAGLNQDIAAQNTVHPLKYIQANMRVASSTPDQPGDSGLSSSDTVQKNDISEKIDITVNKSESTKTPDSSSDFNDSENTDSTDTETVITGIFSVTAGSANYHTSEEISLIITKVDAQGEIDASYQPGSEFAIAFSTDSASYINKPVFHDGKALVKIFDSEVHQLTVTISDQQSTGSIQLNIGSPEVAEVPYTLQLLGDNFAFIENNIYLIIKVLDEGGNLIKDFSPINPIEVQSSGKGQLSTLFLKKDDFTDGVARISYTASATESAVIQVGEVKMRVSFIDKMKTARSLRIEHDGEFIPGMKETITITPLDEDDVPTPNFNYTTPAKVTFIEGNGKLSAEQLTRNNFGGGSAKITIMADEGVERIKIKVGNSLIEGESDYMTASTNIFTDVGTKNSNYKAIKYLKEQNIIGGYADGSFKPEKTVNRAEALKMLLLAFDVKIDETHEVSFTDMDDNSWYASYLKTAVKRGIVNGYPDGSFQSGRTINRAEFMKILLKTAAIEVHETVDLPPYSDVLISDWYAPYAEFVRTNSLLDAVKDRIFPSSEITRGDAAELMYRLLQM